MDLSTEYYLSGEDELRKSLRENAVADSRANAELLARAAGRTITGVDMIDLSERHPRPMRSSRDLSEQEFQQLLRCPLPHSRKLSIPEKELEEEVSGFTTPEYVNNSEQTAPSKRIIRKISSYQKTVDGISVAQAIGIETMIKKCQHFADWVNILRS